MRLLHAYALWMIWQGYNRVARAGSDATSSAAGIVSAQAPLTMATKIRGIEGMKLRRVGL